MSSSTHDMGVIKGNMPMSLNNLSEQLLTCPQARRENARKQWANTR